MSLAAALLNVPRAVLIRMTQDTALAPFDWGTGASRSSLMMGMALQEAANDILRQLGEFVADCFGAQTEGLAFAPGGIMAGNRFWTFEEVLHAAYGIDSGEI